MSAGPPIRVLLVFSAAAIGGAERSLVRMTQAAPADARVQYAFATVGGEGPLAEWLRGLRQEVVAVDLFSQRGIHAFALRTLRRRISDLRPDVIYVVGVRAATLLRLARPLLPRTRIVHGIRAVLTPGSPEGTKFRLPERWLWRLTDGYVANSAAGAAALQALSGVAAKRIRVIANGVVPPAQPARIAGQPPTVAVVANLNPLKGHIAFLEVVRRVVAAVPAARFQFIGRDDMGGAVQRAAASMGLGTHIEFAGFVADVAAALATSRLFVLPSRETEGAPTSILEAQAAGLPAIAFGIGGIPTLIDDGTDGFVIPVGDDAAMASAIVQLLNDDARSAQMGAAGRRKVIADFSLAACASRHAALWQELVGRRP